MKTHRTHAPGASGTVRCAANGCCRWYGTGTIETARLRVFEASRGPLPSGAFIEMTCGDRRCVNLDHLRRVVGVGKVRPRGPACRRGHDLTGDNVVRHRDGRIAYCRACRNDRRRERYRSEPEYARREIERQRRRRLMAGK